jgi:hypothetical protein
MEDLTHAKQDVEDLRKKKLRVAQVPLPISNTLDVLEKILISRFNIG